jgi:hypothetical protein
MEASKFRPQANRVSRVEKSKNRAELSDETGPRKNKAVGAVYRQRPCQPRILKSAYAIR